MKICSYCNRNICISDVNKFALGKLFIGGDDFLNLFFMIQYYCESLNNLVYLLEVNQSANVENILNIRKIISDRYRIDPNNYILCEKNPLINYIPSKRGYNLYAYSKKNEKLNDI